MELAHRWSDRNLTRMELVIASLVLALLIGFFSRYVLLVFAQAERSMMNRTVININTALNYRASMMAMRGQYDELQFFIKMNPMQEMQSRPEINDFDNGVNNISLALSGSSISSTSNYGGIIASDNPDTMEKGKWYFQQDDHVLVYRVSNSEFFSSDLEGSARVRFRIKINFKDNNANGQYNQKIDEFHSVKLQSIDQYIWNI
jgi:hypothetical protein